MRVLIIGLAKSGTTAIFYKIKDALKGSVGLFEPQKFRDEFGKRDVVAKILFDGYMDKNFSSFKGFDKKIIIVRDLRDLLVSHFIFFLHLDFWYGSKKFKKAFELLRKKEENPESISLKKLIEETKKLGAFNTNLNKIRKEIIFAMKFQKKNKDFFVLKYEDLVDGKVKPLEKYLGFKLEEGGSMKKEKSYIIRSKKYGGWKNWFTKEDIEYFKPLFDDYLKKYNYELDWKTNKKKVITSKECSEYFVKSAKDRAFNKLRFKQNVVALVKKPFGILKKNSKFFAKVTRKLRGFENDPIKKEIAKEVEEDF